MSNRTVNARIWQAWLPDTLLGRLIWLMVIGVLSTQGLGNWLWNRQISAGVRQDSLLAAEHMASSASATVRYFRDLPPAYRVILIEQLRSTGGTRFFVNVNSSEVPVIPVGQKELADLVVSSVKHAMLENLPSLAQLRVQMTMPDKLAISPGGTLVTDLPSAWVESSLLTQPRPAPLLVIQAQLEPASWLFLAARMPDPYFLDNKDPLTWDRMGPHLITLLTVLVLLTLVVRSLTRPLEHMAQVTSRFTSAIHVEPVPETGSAEMRRTARAINEMQASIQKYVEDRTRLFAGISHDLQTPITRLKLRTELLDDAQLRNDFHEDLDELDEMVKNALQAVRDSQIHENISALLLDRLIERLIDPVNERVEWSGESLTVKVKPLALRRALGNLIDNAMRYGDRLSIQVMRQDGWAVILLRDNGPGIPGDALDKIGQPYVRLEHGRQRNPEGNGLGLSLARELVDSLQGTLTWRNHPKGGFEVTVKVPLAPDATPVWGADNLGGTQTAIDSRN
jgi:signal transduction histidine kinase